MNIRNLMSEIPKNSITTRDEIRRLQKAARDNDKRKLWEWCLQFEAQKTQEYENIYEEDLGNSIDVFCLALAYTLCFNEKTKFGPKRISDFFEDFFVTVDMFSSGEYSPEDYEKQLAKKGIYFSTVKEIRRKEKNGKK